MTSTLNFLSLPLVQSPRLSNLPGWSLKDGNAFLDKELKECSGHVFVDSVPEFCLPETELIDLSTVDVILISNYHCMMALPYIIEHTGFTGTVYATEPTMQIGRLLMEELVNFIERVPTLPPCGRIRIYSGCCLLSRMQWKCQPGEDATQCRR